MYIYFSLFVIFIDDPFQDPDTSAPVHEDEQMYCIYRSALNKFNLIYSAEINGVISDKKLENVYVRVYMYIPIVIFIFHKVNIVQ